MPDIFEYLTKVSICIILVYLFYRVVLRPLTFYRWNRLYLLIYSLACFVIPFIDLSPSITGSTLEQSPVVQLIPVIEQYTIITAVEERNTSAVNGWTVFKYVLITGALLFFIRLLLQFFSLLQIRKKAALFTSGEIKVYHVGEKIIPFSFGNSIYLNHDLHEKEELQKIILHEYIHVKERHTLDIIWAELFLALNWYNPFAWMIRKSIRQNLEFIADARVLEEGVDKVHYQYLLLKVMGNSGSPVTNQFNFSSLKNRIVMMNKIKTAKIHMARLLFIIPLLAVILLAFRTASGRDDRNNASSNSFKYRAVVFDVSTNSPLPGTKIFVDDKLKTQSDSKGRVSMDLELEAGKHTIRFEKKGYDAGTTTFSINPDKEKARRNFIELHSLKKSGIKAEVSSVSFVGDYNGDEINDFNDIDKMFKQYIKGLKEQLKEQNASQSSERTFTENDTTPENLPGDYKAFLARNPAVAKLAWKSVPYRVVVYLKNGMKEEYELETGNGVKNFEAKYGKAPTAPPPPPGKKGKIEGKVFDAVIEGLTENDPLIFETKDLQWQPGHGLMMHENVLFAKDSVQLSADRIQLKTGDNLVYLNGTEMSTDIIYTKNGEKYKLVQLGREASIKKYGDKGRNGIIEIQKIE